MFKRKDLHLTAYNLLLLQVAPVGLEPTTA